MLNFNNLAWTTGNFQLAPFFVVADKHTHKFKILKTG